MRMAKMLVSLRLTIYPYNVGQEERMMFQVTRQLMKSLQVGSNSGLVPGLMTWPSKMNTRWTVWFSVKDGFEDLSLQGYLHFHVANPTLPWHRLFRVMEEVTSDLLRKDSKYFFVSGQSRGRWRPRILSQPNNARAGDSRSLFGFFVCNLPKRVCTCMLSIDKHICGKIFTGFWLLHFQVFLSFAKNQKGEASWVPRACGTRFVASVEKIEKVKKALNRAPMHLSKSKN